MFSQNLDSSAVSAWRKLGSMVTSMTLHCLLVGIIVVIPLVLADCGLGDGDGFPGRSMVTRLSDTPKSGDRQQVREKPDISRVRPEKAPALPSDRTSKILPAMLRPAEAPSAPAIFFPVPPIDFGHGGCGCGLHLERRLSHLRWAVLFRKVEPKYPLSARQADILGAVIVHAIMDREGSLKEILDVSGPQELREAAIEVVRQLRYPYLLDGVPIEVETITTVKFVLEEPSRQALSRIM